MAIIRDQPGNINFLSPLGFKFKLTRTPNLNFFVTSATLPSLNLGAIEVPTPFKMIDIAGSKLEYGDFTITFRMDEDFQTYLELYEWMVAVGFPENFDQYKKVAQAPRGSDKTIYCDGTLTILTSDMVPNIEIDFQDMFPTSLQDINFLVSDTDVNYVEMTATFKYKIFHVRKVAR